MAISENFLKNRATLTPDAGLVSNLIKGGQLGYGFKANAFDAATPLAMPPAVIVVLSTPTMWDQPQMGSQWDEGVLRQTVKCMFECHAKAVTGIDVSYTLETQEQPVGHDGQQFKVPTQTRRTAIDPSFTWPEVTGNLVWNVIKRWIWDISDPDSNTAFEHEGAEVAEGTLSTYTMSSYAVTFAVIQYDKTMHPDRILDGHVVTNVFPTTTTELGIERTIGTTKVPERAITFSGYQIHNERTKEIARTIARSLKLRGETYKQAATPCRDADPVANVIKGLSTGEQYTGGVISDIPLAKADGEPNNWNKLAPGAPA